MTKVERELIELLEAKYGKAASPSDIIAFLRGVGAIDDILIRKAVIHERFYDRLATTVWQQGRCRSWYQNAHGRNVALWPGSTREFTRLMRRFDPGAYAVTQPKERTHAAT